MGARAECVVGSAFSSLISQAVRETLTDSEMIIMENAMIKSVDVWMVSDGQMLGITGIAPDTLLAREAFIWNYTNPFNRRISAGAIRTTKMVVEHFLTRYDLLVGYCELSNAKSQRWVKWLGADFGQPNGQLIPFTIEAKR